MKAFSSLEDHSSIVCVASSQKKKQKKRKRHEEASKQAMFKIFSMKELVFKS